MEIKKVERKIYDVFLGNGWDNWSRVSVQGSGPTSKLWVIKGDKLGGNQLEDVRSHINAYEAVVLQAG